MTELITMFYNVFYISLLKEILKSKVYNLAHLAPFPTLLHFEDVWFLSAFLFFCFVLFCFMCSFESYLLSLFLFNSSTQLFIA